MRTKLLSISDLADCYPLPNPGVYVDVSIPEEGQATLGLALIREGWAGVKVFSVPSRQTDPFMGEMEAARLAQEWFPDLLIYCDHPDVPLMIRGVAWIDRKQNKYAHRAARLRLNWLNREKDTALPHSRRLIAYARTIIGSALQPALSSLSVGEEPETDAPLYRREGPPGRSYYSGRLGIWVSRGRLRR